MARMRIIIAAAATAAATVAVLAPAGGEAAQGPSADLSVTISDSPDPVRAGATLTYTLGVVNAGPDDATNVVLTDRLAKDASFVSADPDRGSCTASAGNKPTVTCILGAMFPVYDSVGVTIKVKAPSKAGKISNSASVDSNVADPKKPNNNDSETTTVTAPLTPKCATQTATIVGTPGADSLPGTPGVDVIQARAGNDSVASAGSADRVCGAGGNDVLGSGGGGDHVFGGRGRDLLRGKTGGDVLRGGDGNDVLRGGPGPDLLVGGPGVDICKGGRGHDRLRSC